jgi:predicted outer membrane repeat protein
MNRPDPHCCTHLRPSLSHLLGCVLRVSLYAATRPSLAMALVIAAVAGPVIAADAVVGSGTPASCTEAAFDTALSSVQTSGGGTITFNCGGSHAFIFSSQRLITSQVVVDGGDLITLSGGNASRIYFVNPGARLDLRNITLSNGYVATGGGGAIVNGGTLHLKNATFRNNRSSTEGGSGGAILSEGPMTSVNSRFENNSAANGGAVFLRFAVGVGTFTNTTFKDNSTLSATNGWGGAILLWDGAHLTLRGCDFEGNSARLGGAIHNQFANVALAIEQGTLVRSNTALEGGGLWLKDGTTVIDRSLVLLNQATGVAVGGGGIHQEGGTLTIIDSMIAENQAVLGGGLTAWNGVTSLTGTTLVGNASFQDGGAIFVRSTTSAELSLLNSTLSGNTTSLKGWGAGILAYADGGSLEIDLHHVTVAANLGGDGSGLSVGPPGADVTLNLVNTTLADNSFPTCHFLQGGPNSTARYSLWSDTSCSFATSEQNLPNTQAALAPLADNGGRTFTHAPLVGSPLIDNGTCLPGVTTDQRGAIRPHGLACDIGAVEAGAAFPDGIFADRFQSN